MYPLLREILFTLSPESSHAVALKGLELIARWGLADSFFGSPPSREVELFGLKFRNPVGLAAGLDKDGVAIAGLASVGFGFLEVGTVTPRPQSGSHKPRLFRLPKEHALINRMGFNNLGVDHLCQRIEAVRSSLPDACPLGVNIGMNRDTSADRAVDDYARCAKRVAERADYVTVNVSSPNTPGLRDLQRIDALVPLLARVRECLDASPARTPLLVKVSPDLVGEDLDALAKVLKPSGADGVIATNTTVTRSGSLVSKERVEQGGLSGEPLFEKSFQSVQRLAAHLDGLPLIACGGVHDADSARQMLDAGASLVQIYTGFIYQGPRLIRDITNARSARSS